MVPNGTGCFEMVLDSNRCYWMVGESTEWYWMVPNDTGSFRMVLDGTGLYTEGWWTARDGIIEVIGWYWRVRSYRFKNCWFLSVEPSQYGTSIYHPTITHSYITKDVWPFAHTMLVSHMFIYHPLDTKNVMYIFVEYRSIGGWHSGRFARV